MNLLFVLRALAARKLLRQRKFLRRCALGKPVIHAKHSGSETLKEQVADNAWVIGLTKPDTRNNLTDLAALWFIACPEVRA